jgi:hypothetical protein
MKKKRTVAHEALANGRGCACGATFKTPRDLRRHLTEKRTA